MNQSFVSLQFEKISKRFNEIDILLDLAANNQKNINTYQALCRSAHVLLVSHFEGLYKDICKDIIDDINSNIRYFEIKSKIFNTYCNYFIQNNESEKAAQNVRIRLKETLETYQANIKVAPFIFVDNKNPAPQIIETILSKFGIDNFFWAITESDLDIVFEDQKSTTIKLRDRLRKYILKSTYYYPYCVTQDYYKPKAKLNNKKTKTLWEDFLNNFLKQRHDIVHGHTLETPNDHDSISKAKDKIEILIYVFIINICSAANPLFILQDN